MDAYLNLLDYTQKIERLDADEKLEAELSTVCSKISSNL